MAIVQFNGFAANTYAPSYGSAYLEAGMLDFLAGRWIVTVSPTLIEVSTFGFGPQHLLIRMTGSFNISSQAAALNSIVSGVHVEFLQGGPTPGVVDFSSLHQSVSSFLTSGLTQGAFAGSDTITGSEFGDLLRGQAGNDTLSGGAGSDYLSGDAGNDTLLGGTDIGDQLAGGIGDDVYRLTRSDDIIREFAGQGTDRVEAGVSYVLANNLGNLTLTGTGDIDGTGNALGNVLMGNSGNNRVDGGAGNDTMSGAAGDDTYVVGSALDKVIEAANGGVDTVESWVSYTLGANVEKLTLSGSANLNATGNSAVNVLTGNSGNNILDGAAGADTMIGGLGDDTYVIDNLLDVVSENPGEGSDTVQLSGHNVDLNTATEFANIENVTLTGSGAFNLTGNGVGNVLIGNASVNILIGAGGNDTLDGGLGNDTLDGGAGDDTYVLNGADSIAVDASGNDTVKTALTFTLAARPDLENITLLGAAAINATGNDNVNILIGNAAANILDAGLGADAMAGGAGNDTYIVDDANDAVTELLAGGVDLVKSSVDHALAANVENLTLTGTGDIDGTGNALGNVLMGNSGNNRVDGGAGNDTMSGAAGDDTYVVGSALDKVIEAANGGVDTVESWVSYTLGANVEKLTLSGSANLNATGNSAVNVLTGNSGNNILDGAAGADTMIGGLGDDTYVIDNLLDVVSENPGEGSDTVVLPASMFFESIHPSAFAGTIMLEWWPNVENVTLTGAVTMGGRQIFGTAADNTIIGAAGHDNISGGDGNDILMGGAGSDNLYGEAGDDILDPGGGGSAADPEFLEGGTGDDTYIIGNLTTVRIIEAAGQGSDTVQIGVTFDVDYLSTVSQLNGFGVVEIENIQLTGSANIDGFGNDSDNHLVGNAGSNLLVGQAGNDILDGGAGADILVGGTGDDHYVIDSPKDLIIELKDEGNDTVAGATDIDLQALSRYVENAELSGTGGFVLIGNDLDNHLTGNSGNNVLDGGAGNDYLDGGGGADYMIGGVGDDSFVFDNVGDTVTELPGGGSDTLIIDRDVNLGLEFPNFENITLAGTADLDAIGNDQDNHLIGNSGNNTLVGGDGNDVLDGRQGADDMTGGLGDDTYVLNDAGDVFHENSGQGSDIIQIAGRNIDLNDAEFANIENVTLLGAGAFNLTGTVANNTLIGNADANALIGGAGNDVLDGGTGADTMTGGSGDDTYFHSDMNQSIVESPAGGIDTVYTRIGNYTLDSNIENGVLMASATAFGLGLTGNALNNILTGNSGLNIIDGGAGADTMIGGPGDDIYTVDNSGDTVMELNNEGSDSVVSSVSFVLGNNVENLRLSASGLTGTGNELNNNLAGGGGSDTLIGLGGNDHIDGGAGQDILSGGEGDDRFVFDAQDTSVSGGAGFDQIEVSGFGMNADLSSLGGSVFSGMEEVNMRNGTHNEVTLTASTVLALSDTTNALYVSGDTPFFGGVADTVRFADPGWVQAPGVPGVLNGFGYYAYTSGDATVYVQSGGMEVLLS